LPTPSEITQYFFHRDKAFSHLSIRLNSYEIAKASGNSSQMPIIIYRKYVRLFVGSHRFKQSRRKLFGRHDRNVNHIAQGGCSLLQARRYESPWFRNTRVRARDIPYSYPCARLGRPRYPSRRSEREPPPSRLVAQDPGRVPLLELFEEWGTLAIFDRLPFCQHPGQLELLGFGVGGGWAGKEEIPD
jgi:hypothetical protein